MAEQDSEGAVFYFKVFLEFKILLQKSGLNLGVVVGHGIGVKNIFKDR